MSMKFNLSLAIYVLVVLISVVLCSSFEEKLSFPDDRHLDRSSDGQYLSFDEKSSANNEDIESGPNNFKSQARDTNTVALINPSYYYELVLSIHKFSHISMVALSFCLGALLIPQGATVMAYLILLLNSIISILKHLLGHNLQRSVVEPLNDNTSTFRGQVLKKLISCLPSFQGYMTTAVAAICGFTSFLMYHEDISVDMITYVSLFFVFSVLNYVFGRN
jgi:hypothetical protein